MSYYSSAVTNISSHLSQFTYTGIGDCMADCIFINQHDAVLAFNNSPEKFLNFIKTAFTVTDKRIILCLDLDPINYHQYYELLSAHFSARKWFILTSNFADAPGLNFAPWPYFLIAQQINKNAQLGKVKKYRMGFLSGVPRLHRLRLWAAVKDHARNNDVVVFNRFSYHWASGFYTPEMIEFLKTQSLPWSTSPAYIDQDPDLMCASNGPDNSHPAFQSFCNISAETCDDTGPLFFSEKTWKSYISGCLTINYGPLAAPAWLAKQGIEIFEKDLPVTNLEKIDIIVDLFKSEAIEDLYHENSKAIEYNQHLVDSRAFAYRIAEPSITAFLNWLES
jgi:hypothetical protein